MRLQFILALAIILGPLPAAQVTTEVIVRNPAPSGHDGDLYARSHSLSADGRLVAYIAGGQLVVADMLNGTRRPLTAGSAAPRQCHLSANGRWLAVSDDAEVLWLINVATGASRWIGPGRDPRLSSDGLWLAYIDVADPVVRELRLFNRISGVSTPIDVVLGPDQRLFALETMSGNAQVLVYEVDDEYYALDRRSGTTTRIGYSDRYMDDDVSVDQAGRFIAYTDYDGGRGRATILDLTTGIRTQVGGIPADSLFRSQVGPDGLTADGEHVAIYTDMPLLPSDRNDLGDVYVCRWRTGEITRRSLKSDGREANENAQLPMIAANDNRIVIFIAEEWVRFSNPDTSVDPEWPAGSLIRSEYSWRPFAAKINFQPAGAPRPAGYQADSGRSFALRGGGFSFGWRSDNSAAARDRDHARSPDQRWDTHLRMQDVSSPGATWEIAVPDGWYSVRIVAGDPRYFDGRIRIGAEGVVAIDALPGSAQPWQDRTVRTRVLDGRLTIHSLAGSVMNKLCFIEVSSATPPGVATLAAFNIDFQPAGAQRVNGYAPDSGEAYSGRDNGWTYGWASVNATTFERDSARSPDQRYDTGIALPAGARWELALPSGWWAVAIACGDANDSSGRYRVRAEGVTIVDGRPTSQRRFVEGDGEVQVLDGRFTVEAAAGAEDVKLDFIDLVRVPTSPG